MRLCTDLLQVLGVGKSFGNFFLLKVNIAWYYRRGKALLAVVRAG